MTVQLMWLVVHSNYGRTALAVQRLVHAGQGRNEWHAEH